MGQMNYASKLRVDSLWFNVNLATMVGDKAYGVIEKGALAIQGDTIIWVGSERDLPPDLKSSASNLYDGNGGWITPVSSTVTLTWYMRATVHVSSRCACRVQPMKKSPARGAEFGQQ